MYRNPYEKGQLIIQFEVSNFLVFLHGSTLPCLLRPQFYFNLKMLCIPLQVEFPEQHWLPENMYSKLERLLPKRDEVMLTDDLEEVDLCEVDLESQRRKYSGEAYEEDEGPRSHGVQCQTQ